MGRPIFIITAFISVVASYLVQAQPSKILDKVSKKYQGYKTMNVAFGFIALDKNHHQLGGSDATLLLDVSAGQYRVTMVDQEIISNGKTQWQVMKEDKEVQITNVNDDSDQLTPANVFSFYKKGYDYSQLPNEKEGGKSLYAIRLDPQDKKKPFSYVKLRIEQAGSQISDVTVFDKNGGSFTYRIKKLETNKPLPASTFVFDKTAYKGMEIVDLR